MTGGCSWRVRREGPAGEAIWGCNEYFAHGRYIRHRISGPTDYRTVEELFARGWREKGRGGRPSHTVGFAIAKKETLEKIVIIILLGQNAKPSSNSRLQQLGSNKRKATSRAANLLY